MGAISPLTPLRVGATGIYWLGGGDFRLDGGTMFGPVPKVLWQKHFPAAADNTILLAIAECWPPSP